MPTQRWVIANSWLWIVSIVVLFVTLIALACCEGLRRKSPMNFVLLFMFTLAQSFMLGVMSANFEIMEVLLAIGITAVITFSLTIFAFQTKWDFTTMGEFWERSSREFYWKFNISGGVLFVAVIVLLLLGIFAIIFPGRTLTLVYASLGALIFCFYLVYDIQMMMGEFMTSKILES